VDLLTKQTWNKSGNDKFDLTAIEKTPSTLNTIKNTFVTPFKTEGNAWHLSALYVLFWDKTRIPELKYMYRRIDRSERAFSGGESSMIIEHHATPLSYANLLSFLIEIRNQYYSRSDKDKVEKIIIDHHMDNCVLSIKLVFSGKYLESKLNDMPMLRRQINQFATTRSETHFWTMVPFSTESVGDFFRPWRDLIRQIEAYASDWVKAIRYEHDVIRYRKDKYEFAISLSLVNDKQDCLKLEWVEYDRGKTRD
jgi:hypothetical protein